MFLLFSLLLTMLWAHSDEQLAETKGIDTFSRRVNKKQHSEGINEYTRYFKASTEMKLYCTA